jgi:hypothetical protein
MYAGSGYIDPCLLDLGTRWRLVVRFTPGERDPGVHWIGGWVGHRTGLDNMEKIKFLTLLELEL